MKKVILSSLLFVSGVISANTTAHSEANGHSIALKPVAELYTSQSCGRCPKGNDRFAKFVEANDVVGLSFGVDYWNYMGWKDTVAHPQFTKRQKALNEKMGRRGPYTPQVIMNGDDHCAATKATRMQKTLAKAVKEANSISVEYDGNTLTMAPQSTDLKVIKVTYIPGHVFETPKDGKNKNKTMLYHNLAVGLEEVGTIEQGKETSLNTQCASNCAFIFQQTGMGPVVGGFYHETSASGTS